MENVKKSQEILSAHWSIRTQAPQSLSPDTLFMLDIAICYENINFYDDKLCPFKDFVRNSGKL